MTTRTLEHRKNNAYDSILLLDDGKVVGEWIADEHALHAYHNPGDLTDWSETWPDETDPAAYGDLVE